MGQQELRQIISDRIEELGLSRLQVAREINIHETNLYRFLNGQADMKSDSLDPLLAFLKLTVKAAD